MSVDQKTKQAFEIADDSIQATIGYYYYVAFCQDFADKQKVCAALPQQLQITHDGLRACRPKDLCIDMEICFSQYHARVCLISVVSYFEIALKGFVDRLVGLGKIRKLKSNRYKARLEWAFDAAQQSTRSGNHTNRNLVDICLDVDHARRVRNLWVHNTGVVDQLYLKDGITVGGKPPQISPRVKGMSARGLRVVLIQRGGFETMVRSHVALLNHLYNMIQRVYFGAKRSYSYRVDHKQIKWQRLLVGW